MRHATARGYRRHAEADADATLAARAASVAIPGTAQCGTQLRAGIAGTPRPTTARRALLAHARIRYARGMQIHLVGGAVRDRLLGLPPGDRDYVVVGATVEAMRARGFRQVGREFPVFLHPDTGEEYALARTERKHGRGHRGFVVRADPAVTLDEDLARRDFTINAIAEAADGRLHDPFGGQRDLHDRVLRHVGPAFVEDPLRVLRAARFMARFAPLGFTLAAETLALMRAMAASGELAALVPERVWQELARALASARPSAFLATLRDSDALAAVLPELAALDAAPVPSAGGACDAGNHATRAIERQLDAAATLAPGDVEIAFAVLTHALGQPTHAAAAPDAHAAAPHARSPQPPDARMQRTPTTRHTEPTPDPTHAEHAAYDPTPLRALCARLKVPNAHQRLAECVGRECAQLQRPDRLHADALLGLIERCDGLRQPARLRQLALACDAIAGDSTTSRDPAAPAHDGALATLLDACLDAARHVRAADLPGNLGGPALGEALHRARAQAIAAWLEPRRTP
jgi:tRNA nucleotidyltransferase (CCA-adding enzyme)